MKKTIFLILLFSLQYLLFAQAPQKINYQAVARNLSGIPLVNQSIIVKYEIRTGTANGTVVYAETHSLSTNQFGLFTAEVGGGSPSIGTVAGITWGTAPFYLYVEVDNNPMGVTQLLSVPYALFAKESGNGPTGAPGKNSLISITPEPVGGNCSTGGNKIESGLDDNNDGTLQPLEVDYTYYICDGSSGVNGTNGLHCWDSNGNGLPDINEDINGDGLWNALDCVGDTGVAGPPGLNGIIYSSGSGIDLTSNIITNTAPDQIVNLQGTGATTISGSYPNFIISSSDNVNDADSNPTNEIQNLSTTGNFINISGGLGTTISANAPNAGDMLYFNGFNWVSQVIPPDFDNQMLSYSSPSQTISISGGNSITLDINDADANPNNELITSFSVNGTNLEIIESGNIHTVPINSLSLLGKWTEFSGNLFPTTLTNKIGIGTSTPKAKLHVFSSDTLVAFLQGNNSFGTFSITESTSNKNVGEFYLSGSDTLIQSLEPGKKSFHLGYPTPGGKISIEADSIDFIGNNGNRSIVKNDGNLFNRDTIFSDGLHIKDNDIAPGQVLTNVGGGRAQWQNPSTGGGWSTFAPHIYFNAGNVGIGIANPSSAKLYVDNSTFNGNLTRLNNTNPSNGASILEITTNGSGSAININQTGFGPAGLFEISNNTSSATAMRVTHNGGNSKTMEILHTGANSGSADYGLYSAINGGGNSNTAGYFSATGATTNWAGYFDFGNVYIKNNIGVGLTTPMFPLHIFTTNNVRAGYFEVNGLNSTSNKLALTAIVTDPTGTGANKAGTFNIINGNGTNYGVHSLISTSSGTNYGIRSDVTSTATINYGIYASAFGATTNWAGYFASGDVYIQDKLVMPAGAVNGYILSTDGAGNSSWKDPASISPILSAWTKTGTSIYPTSSTDNLAIGINSTIGAKLRVTGDNIIFDNNPTGVYLTNGSSIGDGYVNMVYDVNTGATGAPTMKYIFAPRNNPNTGTNVLADMTFGKVSNQNYGFISFSTKDATSIFAERLRINAEGNVGIGTPAPSAKLDVEGNFKLGVNGSINTKYIAGSVQPNITSLATAVGNNYRTITIPGATTGDNILITMAGSTASYVFLTTASVVGINTVGLNLFNLTGGPVSGGTYTFNYIIYK